MIYMNYLTKISVVLFVLVLFLHNQAGATGVTDTLFGGGGTVAIPITGQTGVADGLYQPDGKFIAVTSSDYGSVSLCRFQANGTLDPTFGSGGTATHTVSLRLTTAALQADGKILVAGSLLTPSGTDFAVMRLNANGAVDTSFGSGGVSTVNQGSSDQVNKIVVLASGKIIAAGHTSDAGGRAAAFRLNTNGSLDNGFAGGIMLYQYPIAPVTFDGFQDVEVLADGRLLTATSAGFYDPPSSTPPMEGYYLVMLTAQGLVDTSFGGQGAVSAYRQTLFLTRSIGLEVMPSGNLFVAYGPAISVLSPSGTFIRDLPFEGNRTQPMSGGRVMVSGDSVWSGSRVGNVKVYTEKNIVGLASVNGVPSASLDGHITNVFFDFNTNTLNLNRFLRLSSHGTALADFDHDGKTDMAVTRGQFLDVSKSGGGLTSNLPLAADNKVIPEMYEQRLSTAEPKRDGIVFATRGVPNGSGGRYTVINENVATYYNSGWGVAGDIPTGGDFDGNGFVDMTVFRPSDGVWYSIFGDNGEFRFLRWGIQGDKPVPADYDYDGITDFAVYRPSTGAWWIRRSSDGGTIAFNFGLSTDIPLTGDFDGDGRADFTVYRPSDGNWYHYLTTDGFKVVRFGLATDIPVPGDYDGDGRQDEAVFRNGTWYLLQSRLGYAQRQFGASNSVPVAVRYDQ